MVGITDEKVERYLEYLMPIKDPLLEELQKQGFEAEVPIIQVPSLRLIQLFLHMTKPKTIIEVGTAIAFSTIWLAKSLPDVKVHSIERNALMLEKARENIEKSGLSDQIILHEGDAVKILPTLPEAEFIFIDAAKAKYQKFLHLAFPLLKVGGIMIFDNILFRGYVADEEIIRTKPMLKKIRKFNDFLVSFPQLETTFVPIGDGLAICHKTEESL